MKKRIAIIFVAIMLLAMGYSVVRAEISRQTPDNTPNAEAQNDLDTIEVYDLWVQTNQARQVRGLKQLKLSPTLNISGTNKCLDMVAQDYWNHNDPNGQEPWRFILDTGVVYKYAGENLSYGYGKTEQVMTGWINSPTHAENLFNPDFDEIGFGVCVGENYIGEGRQTIVVQHFLDI